LFCIFWIEKITLKIYFEFQFTAIPLWVHFQLGSRLFCFVSWLPPVSSLPFLIQLFDDGDVWVSQLPLVLFFEVIFSYFHFHIFHWRIVSTASVNRWTINVYQWLGLQSGTELRNIYDHLIVRRFINCPVVWRNEYRCKSGVMKTLTSTLHILQIQSVGEVIQDIALWWKTRKKESIR